MVFQLLFSNSCKIEVIILLTNYRSDKPFQKTEKSLSTSQISSYRNQPVAGAIAVVTAALLFAALGAAVSASKPIVFICTCFAAWPV